jgi:hypothetical protein
MASMADNPVASAAAMKAPLKSLSMFHSFESSGSLMAAHAVFRDGAAGGAVKACTGSCAKGLATARIYSRTIVGINGPLLRITAE